MKLSCPDCQKPVPANDVNIKLGIGKCLACDAVFSLADQVGAPLGSLRGKLPESPPRNFRIDDFGPDLTISWSWYTHAIWFLVAFAIFWNGILAVWYYQVFHDFFKTQGHKTAPLIALVFSSFHLLAGVGAAYVCLVTIFNRTEVRLRGGELTVTLGPWPAWGNRRVLSADIAQLFCTEHAHRGKRSTSYTYSLNALLTSGERMDLVNNIQQVSDALYLERAIENRLAIRDRRVAGEWKE